MEAVPGIEVWGGIVLNKSVGGINPSAVEWMHRMSGGRGKVVWLPTFDSDKHIKTLVDKNKSGLVVAPGGVVTAPMEEILKSIKIASDVQQALEHKTGRLGIMLQLAEALEVSNGATCHALTEQLDGADHLLVNACLTQALAWASNIGRENA